MSTIANYFKSVLYELGMFVRTWGDREWSIAFICLLALGYFFLKGNSGKKTL